MKIEAPERIWADAKTCTVYMDGSSPIVARDREFRNSTEYVRADLYAKLVAENERLTACRDFWKERFQVETRVRIEAEALSRTGAVKVLEGRLSEEHKRLSDLFVHYNTPGLGAPGFAQDICKRLTSLEESMLKCTRPSEQAVTTVAEAIRAAVFHHQGETLTFMELMESAFGEGDNSAGNAADIIVPALAHVALKAAMEAGEP